jgi:uncharacterized membrane protein YkvA (DUF1232 family)
METVYDWVTLALFAGIIVLFLQRSSMDNPPDRMIDYLPPAIGCALANYAGNEGYPLVAWPLIAAVIGYVVLVLKPKFN